MRFVAAALIIVLSSAVFCSTPVRPRGLDLVPGNLYVPGHHIGYWADPCPQLTPFVQTTFTIYGAAPSEAYASLSFTVRFSEFIIATSKGVANPDAVELGDATDDDWELQFTGCQQPGEIIPLVTYTVYVVHTLTQWICLSAPDQPEPNWTLCSGSDFPGGRFPVDAPPLLDGCMAVNATFECPVSATHPSWGMVKSRY